MEDLEYRIIFDDPDEQEEAETVLEESGNDFDYDNGDRMMISLNGLTALDEAGVDYTEVKRKEHKQRIFGEYLFNPCQNAFNSKVSYRV